MLFRSSRTEDGYDSLSEIGSKPQIIWFLHFHKAGGNSLTTLAEVNKETKRELGNRQGHSHFELTNEKFRWELVDPSSPSSIPIPSSCLKEKRQSKIGKTLSFQQELRREIVNEGVTLVSTEHWFPALHHDDLANILPSNVKTIVIFREPISRLVSSYFFHDCDANRCPDTAPCQFLDWIGAESNMYTRMLNGQPFGPMKIGKECSLDYSKLAVNQSHLENAKKTLTKFDLIITLDTLSKRPQFADCALRKVLGWNHTQFPHVKPPGKKKDDGKHCDNNEIKEREYLKAKKLNSLDLELYQYAVRMESKILSEMECFP